MTFTDVSDIVGLCREDSVVAVVAVMPQALALKVEYLRGSFEEGCAKTLAWTENVFTALSVPAPAVEGQARMFEHDGFVDSRGDKI